MGRTCKESVDEAREEMSGRRRAVSRSSRVGEEARGEEAKEAAQAGRRGPFGSICAHLCRLSRLDAAAGRSRSDDNPGGTYHFSSASHLRAAR